MYVAIYSMCYVQMYIYVWLNNVNMRIYVYQKLTMRAQELKPICILYSLPEFTSTYVHSYVYVRT